MAADTQSPRTTSAAPSRRWFWLLLVVSVAALILGGTALALELTRGTSGPTTVYSATFVMGTLDTCPAEFASGFCDFINFSLPGTNSSHHLVLVTASLNGSCPQQCSVDLGSYPLNGRTPGFAFAFDRSGSGGGELWGGPAYIQVWESSYCPPPGGACQYPRMTATIEIQDYGVVGD